MVAVLTDWRAVAALGLGLPQEQAVGRGLVPVPNCLPGLRAIRACMGPGWHHLHRWYCMETTLGMKGRACSLTCSWRATCAS